MKKDEKKPYKLKKGLMSAVLGVSMLAGSAGMLVGCDNGVEWPQGDDAVGWYGGKDVPTTSAYNGKVGDFYFDLDDYDIYRMTSDGWVKIGSVDNLDVKDGKDGATWISGTIDPVVTDGNVGDYYLNEVTFNVFKKTSGTVWEKVGNIKGKDAVAQNGKDGKDGLSWLGGESDPEATDGKVGDYYLNESSYNVFKKTGDDVWTKLGNIKGKDAVAKDGEDGSKIFADAGAPEDVEDAKTGDLYFDKTASDVYMFDGEEWSKIANIKGKDGKDGLTPKIIEDYWWIGETNTGIKAKGEKPVITINDEGNWVIDDVDTKVSALGEKGEKGETGATFKSVVEIKEDKWGISSHFEFTLNDEDETVIKTASIANVLDNYYYTAETEKDIHDLIALGVENIKLDNDITMIEALTIPHDVSFDLDNNKLTYSNVTPVIVENGYTLEFKDGDMDFNAPDTVESSIKVYRESSLILDDVEYICKGTCVTVWGDAAKLEIKDSKLVGGTYAVGTNAKDVANYGVIIDLEDSEFDVTGYSIDPTSKYCLDDCAILINVPSEVNIKGCKITGDRQAMIVRGGKVTLEDCELINTANHSQYNEENTTKYLENVWSEGNEVPMATLVVGNYDTSAYQYATNLTIIDTDIISERTVANTIYAIGNEGEDIGVTINIDIESFNKYLAMTSKFNSNVVVNVAIATYEELKDAIYLSVAGNAEIMPHLVRDIIIDEELDFETYCMLDNLNTMPEFLNGYKVVIPEEMVNLNVAYVSNAEILKLAIEKKVKYISIYSNYDHENGSVMNINYPLNIDYECILDLNGSVLNVDTTEQSVITGVFSIGNGTINMKTAKPTQSAFKVTAGAILNFGQLEMFSDGSGVIVEGKDATFNMFASALQANTWGVATNANNPANYYVNINITDSIIRTAEVEEDDFDNTAVMLNVPGTMNISNSYILADRSALLVRGGNATVTNCLIGLTGRYTAEDKYLDANWSEGNEVPTAVVVVGNRSASAYRYDTNLTLNNTNIGACDINTLRYYYDHENEKYVATFETEIQLTVPYIYAYDMDTTEEGTDIHTTIVNNHFYDLNEKGAVTKVGEVSYTYNYVPQENQGGNVENGGDSSQVIANIDGVVANVVAEEGIACNILVTPYINDEQVNSAESHQITGEEVSAGSMKMPSMQLVNDNGLFYYTIQVTNNSNKDIVLTANMVGGNNLLCSVFANPESEQMSETVTITSGNTGLLYVGVKIADMKQSADFNQGTFNIIISYANVEA